jgi:hypothetical protein
MKYSGRAKLLQYGVYLKINILLNHTHNAQAVILMRRIERFIITLQKNDRQETQWMDGD